MPTKVGGWDVDRRQWHIFGGTWKPTHWQPLPEPPTNQPQAAGGGE
nr:DUF551 domain-containing protein [Roseomonas sp. SXEYE001]